MNSQKFAGKVVIVTGSSAGIGRGIALLLGQQGASVTIHGRSLDGITETRNLMTQNGVDKEKIHSVQGDIQDPKTTEALINETLEKFGKIDVLVNNAGIGAKKGATMDSDENLDFLMDVNLKSAIRLIRLAAPHLEKTRGNVVNVSSIVGIKPFSAESYYAMTKASLDHYTRHAAPTLARSGIRMNNLNPGLVHSKFFSRLDLEVTFDQIAEGFVKKEVPMGRTGTALDMANAVSYLASEEAAYVTGITLVVDGGALLGNGIRQFASYQ